MGWASSRFWGDVDEVGSTEVLARGAATTFVLAPCTNRDV
jgi:hypothetical protein